MGSHCASPETLYAFASGLTYAGGPVLHFSVPIFTLAVHRETGLEVL